MMNTTTAGRNPGGTKDRPYCLVDGESGKWEYCDLPTCGKAGYKVGNESTVMMIC